MILLSEDVATAVSTDTEAFLRLLVNDGDVVEIRAPQCPQRKGASFKSTASGYFTDLKEAARMARWISDQLQPAGVYCTLNPVDPILLARSPNKIEWNVRKGEGTNDENIVKRRWLLLDFDPVRPANVSSTDEEMQAALSLAAEVAYELSREGWPEPIQGMSGNGAYSLYRIDLQNTPEATNLVHSVLHGLAERFDTKAVKIDTTTSNASRIAKVFGTVARKGGDWKGTEGNPARPHRQAWFSVPTSEIQTVPVDRLLAVRYVAPEKPSMTGNNATAAPYGATPRLDRCLKWLETIDNSVQGQKGSDPMLEAACETYRFDLSESDRWTALQWFNTSKCSPQWSEAEIRHKVEDAAKKVSSANDIGCRNQALPAATTGSAAPPPPRKINVISSADFEAADYEQRYLCTGILVAQQPTVVAARSKCMKTSGMIDMAVSLASGTKFLNTFDCVQATVGMFSGESGAFTIRQTARQVCNSKGLQLRDLPIYWGFDLPQIARPEDIAGMCDVINDNKLQVIIVDPAYLCLLAGDVQGRQASNVFDMGSLLMSLTTLGQNTKSTIILVHHCRKNMVEPWQPPELEDMSMAGFAEWARQWLLIGRRAPFQQGSGYHQLWLNVGGSAGHSGCWAVDIDEGRLNDDFTGRKWEVSVNGVADAKREAENAKANKKAAENTAKAARHAHALLEALKANPEGQTARKLRTDAGLNADNFAAALATLRKEGRVEDVTVIKGNTSYEGYKWTGQA